MKAQIIMIVLMSLGLLIHATKDGQLRNERYNLSIQMLSAIIYALLLWWGGFWEPLLNG